VRRLYGVENRHTLDAANSLATVLVALGELAAARQLSEDTLSHSQRVFGDNHPRTRKAADNLAAALQHLREAESSSWSADADSGPTVGSAGVETLDAQQE
ncbi:MAG: tetratricopeptide repeat protein, partial [Acidobacteria bacterium]|nr:tetratricopeptide repeat protein [Acidobacteriota bacterium]